MMRPGSTQRRAGRAGCIAIGLALAVVAAACGGDDDDSAPDDSEVTEVTEVTTTETDTVSTEETGGSAEGEPVRGGSLTIGLTAETDRFDPGNGNISFQRGRSTTSSTGP